MDEASPRHQPSSEQLSVRTIELAVPWLLPANSGDCDGCLERLAQDVMARPGIRRAHLEREQSPVRLCLHYDPLTISEEGVRHAAKQAGGRISRRYLHYSLQLEGLDCSDCALVVQHRLSRLEGVLSVEVDYACQLAQVEYDARRISRREIQTRIRQLGYELVPGIVQRWLQNNWELLFSLAAGFLLLVTWAGMRWLNLSLELGSGLYLLAYCLAGFDVMRHALSSLRQRRFDTDMLMLVAALGAASLGNFAEGALLLFLFSLGHALEERALDRARQAMRALGAMVPRSALVHREQGDLVMLIEAIRLDEIVIVRPGERLPVDGEVVTGHSAVDQSPITGESLPIEKSSGDMVYAGSVNGEGALQVRTTRLARESTLARVMKMVEEAQAHKAPTQRLVDRFMRFFVPGVLALTGLLAFIPPLWGVPFALSFSRAMTLLVAASPCALALGTPSAVLAGIAQAARNGVLIKGGAHLENLGRLEAIAFDKTATLTEGQPRVTEIISADSWTEDEVLALAAAIERQSGHPVAQAVVRAAEARELALPLVSTVEAQTGRGIRARAGGQDVRVGSPAWYDQVGLAVPRNVRRQIEALEKQGKTIVLVAQGEALMGLVAIADTLRPTAPGSLNELRRLGVRRMVMLSGDNHRAAAYIAEEAGLQEYRAELLPEDKLSAVDELLREHAVVGMVGDGVNDAPALARATVGIAIGGASTDVALETADVALMAADLSKLPFALGLGRAARRVIVQNLWIAVWTMVILGSLAVSGLAGLGMVVVFHEGSTLLVVINALRLLRYY
jgi:Cd2+/Zn2+-exporting ATPase